MGFVLSLAVGGRWGFCLVRSEETLLESVHRFAGDTSAAGLGTAAIELFFMPARPSFTGWQYWLAALRTEYRQRVHSIPSFLCLA